MTTLGPISVSTGANDGYAGAGSFVNSGPELYCGNIGGGTYGAWIWFGGVTVPQGATINSATLALVMDYVPGGTVSWKCRGADADDPSVPTDLTSYNAISWTTAETTGTDAAPASLNINVASIVQEIVDRGGFGEDKMGFQVIDNGSSTSNWMTPNSYEGSGTEPRLTIDYTEAGGGGGSAGARRRRTLICGSAA